MPTYRHCEIVIDQDKLKVDIQATCMQYQTIKQWAYILHDKDDTRPHYHIYLNFGKSSTTTLNVAKWFQLGYVDKLGNEQTGENFIERIKGRKTDMLIYLTHGREADKNKHQYSQDEVISNFDFVKEIEKSKILGDFEKYSYAQQLDYVNSLPVSEKTQAYRQLKALWELECIKYSMQPDRNIEVIFIYGPAGTGKTFYAKKMLEEIGYDFCISSSSNDPFQDYLGQRAIILDDMRDKIDGQDGGFEFQDLLKVLDNHTNSSVKSRFMNKVFRGKCIVITSPKPLCNWYASKRYDAYDSLKQLYRRITTYIEVKEKTITVFDGVDENGKPNKDRSITYVNEIKELTGYTREKTDVFSIFAKIAPIDDGLPNWGVKK